MNSKNILFALFTTGTLLATSIDTQAQKTLSKEISQEVPSVKGSLIRVVTASRKVSIKSWDQPRVKVTIELAYDSSAKSRSDADWFQDLGINIKPFSNRVDILTGTASYAYDKRTPVNLTLKKSLQPSNQSGSIYYRDVTVVGKPAQAGTTGKVEEVIVRGYSSAPVVRIMNIMVPTGVRLDIENKYGDVVIAMNVDQAKLEVTNGALDAQDIKDLQLVGNYCNANLGNIEKAEIEFNNGTFRAQEIKDLDLDSKSSTIEYEKGGYLYLRSQADNIAIDAIDKIDGRKTYGSIKVDKLNSSFDLEGNNVDIKFRDISPEATLIKINDRYGDVRLPVKSLKNYYVDFIGNYSTVFASFQKEVVKEEEVAVKEADKKDGNKELALKEVTIAGTQAAVARDGFKAARTTDVYYGYNSTRAGGLGEVAPRHFTSSVGDTKGKHTRFELTCHSCTVDFK